MKYILVKTEYLTDEDLEVYGVETIEEDKCLLMKKAIENKMSLEEETKIYSSVNDNEGYHIKNLNEVFEFHSMNEEQHQILNKYGLDNYGVEMFKRLYEDLVIS